MEVAAGEHVLLEGAHQGPGVLLELGHQRDLADARQVHAEPLQLLEGLRGGTDGLVHGSKDAVGPGKGVHRMRRGSHGGSPAA